MYLIFSSSMTQKGKKYADFLSPKWEVIGRSFKDYRFVYKTLDKFLFCTYRKKSYSVDSMWKMEHLYYLQWQLALKLKLEKFQK